MDIDFKKNDMWVLVAQHGKTWGYSDTGATPGDLHNKNKQKSIKEMTIKCWQLGLNVIDTLPLSLIAALHYVKSTTCLIN